MGVANFVLIRMSDSFLKASDSADFVNRAAPAQVSLTQGFVHRVPTSETGSSAPPGGDRSDPSAALDSTRPVCTDGSRPKVNDSTELCILAPAMLAGRPVRLGPSIG